MTIFKSRGATQKLGPINFGSKIVRFRVSNIDKRFIVHEDLICHTSTLFKTKLQKNRRIRKSSSSAFEECCICQDDLNPITKDITYCITCGKDIHDICIEKWKRTAAQREGGRTLPTCPMCRAPWKNEPLLKHLNLHENLDADAVQIYIDWMYSSAIRVPSSITRNTDAFNVMLMKCWAVASAVQDMAFRNAVIYAFFTVAEARFWGSTVHWAFVEGNANAEIKDFVMEIFMNFTNPGWFKRHGAKWPGVFVRSLADRILGSGKRKDYHEVRSTWLERLEIETGNSRAWGRERCYGRERGGQ
ncbi:hypothetical protein BDU57DRAFT_561827 [Ampelomyces quisqualis]|uniref:RING-type domain-containing protein n=1 Tax=Ampelomyces quisqualis TaxID=50730 RepID=A0A6A5R0L5_AMPQU|nr:hypothetical protein BDU57DRAFT_561827 [Ampelomyces quisqualis]